MGTMSLLSVLGELSCFGGITTYLAYLAPNILYVRAVPIVHYAYLARYIPMTKLTTTIHVRIVPFVDHVPFVDLVQNCRSYT